MKIMGMSIRSPAISDCNSRPLRPGNVTSNTRQLGANARGWARNSRADSNTSGRQPAWRISVSSASRTDISSSTTNTIGVVCDMGNDLIHPKRGVNRLDKGLFTDRLEQAIHGALPEQARAQCLIPDCSNENDRNGLPPTHQFSMQIGT